MGKDDDKMVASTISNNMIKPFNGEGDVVGWLKKIELVAKLTKVEDEALFIPLYLEGGALAMYLEMSDTDQSSATAIKNKLKEAFCDNKFVSYSKLINYKWTGEPVDIFANELRRLSGLAGFKGDAAEQVVRLAFVTGFPDDIGVELQQLSNVDTMKVSEILGRARILAANRTSVEKLSSAIGAVALKDVDKERNVFSY